MSLPAIIFGIGIICALSVFIYLKLFWKPKRLQKIWQQIQAGETRSSIRNLRTIIVKQGGSVDAHYMLAECYRHEGNCQMAVVEYRFCLKINRKPLITTMTAVREGLVDCYLKLKKIDEALSELLELSRNDTKNPRYLFEIARIFYRKGNLEQAVSYFDRTVKVDPTHAPSLSYLGMIMFSANQVKEALSYLTRAVKYDPKNYQAHYYLGRLYMDGRDFNRALTYFDAAQRSPDFRVRAFLQKGICYRELDEFDNAVDELKKGVASARGKDQRILLATKYILAALFESRGKLAEAVEQWEGIYRIDAAYRDVARKLEKYQALRTDDNMKDYLVSPIPVFEGMILDIVKQLGYDMVELKHINSGISRVVATPAVSSVRTPRRQFVYIKIYRDAVTLGLNAVRTLLDEAKSNRCTKAVLVSPSSFGPDAIEYAQNRQIDLIGGEQLSEILAAVRG
jgi:tetratricopeptide (TPR) repeat protein